MKEIAIVYPVAGIAARFGGKLKWLAQVGPDGETLIEYSLNQAIKAGFNKIVFIVGTKTEEAFKEKFKNSYKGIPVFYAFQTYDEKERDKPWGTADALCSAKEILKSDFVFCNGDDIYGESTFKILYNHLQSSDDEATIGYILKNVLPENGKVNRAIFNKTEGDYVENIKEFLGIEKLGLKERGLDNNDLCSMNIYALHKETLKLLCNDLENFKKEHANDRKIERLIQDSFSNLIKNKKIKMKLYDSQEEWFGITNPEDEFIVKERLSKINFLRNKNIDLVYLVAGLSSRFGGKIKSFAKVGPEGESLIEYSLNQALKNDFSKIIFVVGKQTIDPFKEMFKDNYKGIPVYYVLQDYDTAKRDRPWGTGDAVCVVKDIIDSSFIMCNGDDIYGESTFKILYDHLQSSDDEATIGYRLKNVIPKKGRVNRAIFYSDKDNNVTDIKEFLGIEKIRLKELGVANDDLCSMNIYALHKETLELLYENLENFKKKYENDRNKEFFIPDQLSNLIKDKKIRMKLYPCEEKWLGLTNPEDEEMVRSALKMHKN